MKLGLSGNLARAFIRSPLTPLILMAALAMGFLALMVTTDLVAHVFQRT